MLTKEQKEKYMHLAFEQAKKAEEQGEVPIGAVVVDKDGNVIGEGYNRRELDEDATQHAEMIEKDTFEPYVLQTTSNNAFAMTREEAIQTVAAAMSERDCAVSTTGMISRELYEYRTAQGQGHERDFLTVGSMGLPLRQHSL